ncbi:glycerophosphodiester phosphodiesterase [Barrientosiimonas humi]|uniref:glycerophosphodiester phosphodiesterase n=1 Tax=Barrientosiimonas humi TaxID=999931 RepID=UPI00370D967B
MHTTLSGLRPEVVAHRGSSHTRPEHTAAAYLLAIEEGADAVECDVRLTADRHLVCVHDRRIDRTSTGAGLVSSLTLEQLMEYDYGTWRDQPSAGVLTFDSLLDLLAAAPRRVDLAVETKHPNKFRGAVEVELARVLRDRGLAPEPDVTGADPTENTPENAPDPDRTRVRAMSFSVLAMRRVGELLPGLPRVLLNEAGVRRQVRTGGLPYGIPICGISTGLLRRDPGMVQRQHERGHAVHVYTVDEPDDIRRCLEAGIDGIITNRPAVVREAVAAVWDSR